jgi:hypothetical protein
MIKPSFYWISLIAVALITYAGSQSRVQAVAGECRAATGYEVNIK